MTAPVWLTVNDTGAIADRLRLLGWLAPHEVLTGVSPAGDGNLNLVLRIAAGDRTAILKQARPWVERYPTIAAPVERSAVEARFYQIVNAAPGLQDYMPDLLGVDSDWHLMLLEDLGTQGDATAIYAGAALNLAMRARLIDFLVQLHALDLQATPIPDNRAMLALNHAHIFALPFIEAAAERDLALIAAQLGARYLSGAGALLHGDFFPGAWVYAGKDVKVIDPEFCLIGPPEFDVGVMAAHLIMAGGGLAMPHDLATAYQSSGGARMDLTLVGRFAGVEIWRRMHGVAQLPLTLRDDARAALIALAARLMRS